MPRLRRWTISVTIAAIMLLAMVSLSLSSPFTPVARGQSPTVTIDPTSAEVALDGTVDVDIVISDVTALWAASIDISFDTSVLEVVDADPGRAGTQLFTGTFPCPSEGPCDVTENTVDNTAGSIEYDATLVEPASPAGGSGTLATIRFHAKSPGTGSIAIQSAALWGPGPGDNLTLTAESGEVVVGDAPTNTPQPAPTSQATATRMPTSTPHSTNTPAPTRTPKPTNTPKGTNTPKPTVTPKPPMENPEPTKHVGGGAAGAQPTPSGGVLPSAGTGEMPQQIWRWFFLSGALVLGLATWAFTFRFYARQKESERFWHR